MPTFDGFDPGNTCWVDLGTSDPQGAIAFYGELFSWLPEEGPRPDGFTNMTLNGEIVAAIAPAMRPKQPTAWTTYIAVSDADSTAQAIAKSGGGVVVPPTSVDELGRYAVANDTSGAVFCIWEPGSRKGVELANEANTWGYSEVHTADTKAAMQFYSEVFGWEAMSNEAMGLPGWSWYRQGKHLGGLMESDGALNGWLAYFGVADIEASVSLATARGGWVISPITGSPIGSLATIADPQGAPFGLMEMGTETT